MTEEIQKIKDLYIQGMKHKEIAKIMNSNEKRITSIVHLLIKTGEVEPRINRATYARQQKSEERLKTIIPMYEKGMTYSQIAKQVDVSYSMVRYQIKWAIEAGICKEYKPDDKPKTDDGKGPNGGVICNEAVRKKCVYGDDGCSISMCNYLFITGEMRPCSGKDCTCYKERTRKRRNNDVFFTK